MLPKTVLALLLGGFVIINSTTTQAVEIKIQVEGIDTKRGGNIIAMVFSEDGFPKIHKKALAAQTKRANKKTMEFTLAVDADEVAIKILHDENGDGKVTKNWTGIFPKEGLGFSNGQKINFGPPSYQKSKLSKAEFINGLKIPLFYP